MDDSIPRGIGIAISGAWIVFSAMNYERALYGPESNAWFKGFVVLGLVMGLPAFARFWMAEGRARERAEQERRRRPGG
jgi:hypothetical protein